MEAPDFSPLHQSIHISLVDFIYDSHNGPRRPLSVDDGSAALQMKEDIMYLI